jgi:transposase
MVEVSERKGLPSVTSTLHINYREMERLKIITRIEQADLTVVEGAEALDLSERHVYRVLRRYRTEGEAGLIHQLRGRASNKAFETELRTKAVRLYREQYSDYGPTLFVEKLSLYHEVTVSRQTATRWLVGASLWAGSRKKRPHRKRRIPRSAIGSLIQFDGSSHDSFEGRGPVCCLLVAIDDASNRVMLRFVPVEDTHHVLGLWRDYIQRYGIPAEVYTDKHAVYRDAENPEHLTQFGRALAALNIRHIKAHSPQAKGRVERVNRTLQDRLLRALREQKISSIDQANQFLEQYTADHNQRFAHLDGLSDIHRAADGIDVNNVFCIEEQRSVNYDWTITVHAQCIPLVRSDVPLPPPRSKVTLRQWLDGSLHIFWNEHELMYQALPAKPYHDRRPSQQPSQHHPWRGKLVGGITAARRSEKTLALKKTKTYNGKASSKTQKSRRQGSIRRVYPAQSGVNSAFPSSTAAP